MAPFSQEVEPPQDPGRFIQAKTEAVIKQELVMEPFDPAKSKRSEFEIVLPEVARVADPIEAEDRFRIGIYREGYPDTIADAFLAIVELIMIGLLERTHVDQFSALQRICAEQPHACD
jgi:hypothetical protein